LEGGTEQKNILFLFRKNPPRAKSRKRRIFFCEVAAGALAEAGGGALHYARYILDKPKPAKKRRPCR
jgi:hypothetical protein